MKIDFPTLRHMPQLRELWQDAFGDSVEFLDSFYRTAYSPDRCRCILMDGQAAAVLYWIDCELDSRKLAYLYAVATHPAHRGKGLCRKLMEDTHQLLASRGYAGALLVPQKEPLRRMYAGMGYESFGGLDMVSCTAGRSPVPIRAICPEEFAALRRKMAPVGAVIQEGAGLSFLADQLQFYAGDDFLLAAYGEKDMLSGVELLGNPNAAGGILNALGFSRGDFRLPGRERPFAMFHPLSTDIRTPDYFGFAFD